MPRKKRTTTATTAEKTNTKTEAKSAVASRSKSRSVKPKRSPAKPRKTSTSKSAARSKSTARRGRPAKSKAPIALEDLSRESSVASETPEKKKPGRKGNSNVEKSVGRVKKEEKTKTTTKTPGRPKSKGRAASKAKAAKSTSKAPKAKEVKEIKEEVQTRSARKPRKTEKKEEFTPTPSPEPPKGGMTTPKRRKAASRTQVTPATEKARPRVKASVVCKKEDTISDRSEREDDFKGRSKRKEKKQPIPSRTQAKMLKKKMKKEPLDLPRFPNRDDASIEGLIVEAIKGLKTKAMEDRIIGYLGKRFSDVDGGNIKNVLKRMEIDETLLMKGLGGGSVSCGKRDFDRNGTDSMEVSLMKKVKTSRNSSPVSKDLSRGGRRMQVEDDRKSASVRMEVETVGGGEVKSEEDTVKKMEEEKPTDVLVKEEAEKVEIPPILIQEEEEIVMKLSAVESKKALIEYYEKKLLGIRGLLTTDKKDKKNEITPDPDQGITPNPVETPMPPQGEMQPEAKKEEQDEVRTTSIVRQDLSESVEQIASEKRNLSFDKEPLLEKKQSGTKGNGEKIEEDESRGMVIWEMQQTGELDKTIGNESLKEAGQENGIELLMKLLTLPGVVTPEGTDDQKVEEIPQRMEEEKKVETSCEKIEETAENRAAEEASTKTEPKVEEPVEKAEEGVTKGGNNDADLLRKKMRTAVETYLEMLQGRIDLDYNKENAENNLSTSEEDKENKDSNKIEIKDVDKKIEEDYVKEESDLERPQKLSVSKFLN